jgi:hypothetical protein
MDLKGLSQLRAWCDAPAGEMKAGRLDTHFSTLRLYCPNSAGSPTQIVAFILYGIFNQLLHYRPYIFRDLIVAAYQDAVYRFAADLTHVLR